MKTNKPVTSQQLALALLSKVSKLSNSRQQLIAKHEASLRALRLVQSDRDCVSIKLKQDRAEIANNKDRR